MMHNKRGNLYVFGVCIFGIVILIAGYVLLAQFYDTNGTPAVEKNIGGKQGAILKAVREGERVHAYLERAVVLAAQTSAQSVTCGEAYLNTRLLGRGTCDGSLQTRFTSALATGLAQYPEQPLFFSKKQITFTDKGAYTQATIHGTLTIPVGTGIPHTSYAGSITTWPTEDVFVTSYFGNRDIAVEGSSKNHPGIDIRVPIGAHLDRTEQPVTALLDGTAVYYERGDASFVRVTNDELIIEYVHIRAAANIPPNQPTPVKAGAVLGYTLNPPGGAHLHLQMLLPDITPDALPENWRGIHSGPTTENTLEQSYASIQGDNVRLDPVCFFERSFITEVLLGRKDNDPSNDLASLPADTFAACDAYEAAFGLSNRFSHTVATPAPTGETGTPVGEMSDDTPPDSRTSAGRTPTLTDEKMRTTYDTITREGYGSIIAQASQDHSVDQALLLAIITQESQGNANAVSPTGAAGIAQFTSSTAQGNEFREYFTRVTACCTAAQASAGTCNQPAVQQCSLTNDDRFNPTRSINAQAVLLSGLVAHYKEYDDGVAFAIASYNGGTTVIDAALRKLNSDHTASWSDVRAVLQTLPVDAFTPKTEEKRKEIIDYTDKVTSYYRNWGGAAYVATGVTTEQLGTYTLQFTKTAAIPQDMNALLAALHETISACADEACITAAIARADKQTTTTRADGSSRFRFTITPEDLTKDAQGYSCLSESARKQAYVANQFQWCMNSPDSACSCAFSSNQEGFVVVTQSQTFTKDESTRIEDNKFIPTGPTKPLAGIGYEVAGDSAVTVPISRITFAQGEAPIREETPREATLYLADKKIYFSSFVTGKPFDFLYKDTHALAFGAGELPIGTACVTPPQPRAYCISDADNPENTVVFFVDYAAHSVVTDTPELVSYEQTSGLFLKKVVVLSPSKHAYPYVHVVTVDSTGAKREHYLQTVALGAVTLDEQQALARGGTYVALRSADKYTLVVPRFDTASLTIQFMDENLREGPALSVENTITMPATQ